MIRYLVSILVCITILWSFPTTLGWDITKRIIHFEAIILIRYDIIFTSSFILLDSIRYTLFRVFYPKQDTIRYLLQEDIILSSLDSCFFSQSSFHTPNTLVSSHQQHVSMFLSLSSLIFTSPIFLRLVITLFSSILQYVCISTSRIILRSYHTHSSYHHMFDSLIPVWSDLIADILILSRTLI